jgi:hypothetical protein
MAMLECPSISETILGCPPFASSSVAQVCLRSWNLMSGSPTRLRSCPWALSRDLDAAYVYAISRISDAPSASTRIVKSSAVVAIGVDRGGVGREDGLRAELPLRKAEKEHYSKARPKGFREDHRR